MDKFISIGVNQGDAFYLERSDFKVLIDGGRARVGFPQQFKKTIGDGILDVVVCTHADADHIDGLLGFFETGLKAKEVWLPGRWTSHLRDLLVTPELFIRQLIDEIVHSDIQDATNLEELFNNEKFLEKRLKDSESKESSSESKESSLEIEAIYQAIEEASLDLNLFNQIMNSSNSFYWFRLHMYPQQLKILFDAIDTAKKIRDLAILAYHSGTKIRWFEFQKTGTASGGEDYLKPVNSIEVFRISKPINDTLLYLYLSKANKESLVFYSPDKDDSNSVLLSADSDFSFKQPLPKVSNNPIITAPHHGSKYNSKAYIRLDSEGYIKDNTIIVRSDGNFKKRPGDAYIKLKVKKICTLCRNSDRLKQDVIFNSSSSGWSLQGGLEWCDCT